MIAIVGTAVMTTISGTMIAAAIGPTQVSKEAQMVIILYNTESDVHSQSLPLVKASSPFAGLDVVTVT